MTDEARHRLYRFLGYGVRIYVVVILGAAIYSVLWLAERADLLEADALAIVWIAVGAMGIAFLVLLVPMFYSSRDRTA